MSLGLTLTRNSGTGGFLVSVASQIFLSLERICGQCRPAIVAFAILANAIWRFKRSSLLYGQQCYLDNQGNISSFNVEPS